MLIRFWNWLTKPKPFEPCEVCNLLRDELSYERARFAELQEVMVSLLKPVPIIREGVNPNPKPISTAGKLWSRRRHELEKQDRIASMTKATSPVIAKPDAELKAEEKPAVTPMNEVKTVDQLELELGVVETEGVH